MTDWLYELPVPRPDPGELLYATSFDAFNDEWTFPGRDEAQIVSTSQIELAGLSSQCQPVDRERVVDQVRLRHAGGNCRSELTASSAI
jgi:hypothetical protein